MTRFHIFLIPCKRWVAAVVGWNFITFHTHFFLSLSVLFNEMGSSRIRQKQVQEFIMQWGRFFCDVLFSVWVWLKNCDGDDDIDDGKLVQRERHKESHKTHTIGHRESRTSFLTINNHPTRRRMASNGMSKEGREEEWNLSRICKAERGNERTNSQFPSSEFD